MRSIAFHRGRQSGSGPGPAYHGRITKQGRGRARGMLVEAAWAAARAPGPLRAFFLRVRARRGQHVAAVATARKLAVLIWHLLSKGESYAWARPALHARKLRDLELKAGYKAERGQRGAAHAYNIKSHRDQERRWVEQAETAYARFVAGWNPRGPKQARTGAAPRGDDEGCAAGLAPPALLFATRSPVRGRKITQIQQKILVDHISRPRMLWLRQPVVNIIGGAGIFEGMRSEGLLLGDHLPDSTGDQESPVGSVKWVPLSVRTVWTL